jgi:YD repeat-containing protein
MKSGDKSRFSRHVVTCEACSGTARNADGRITRRKVSGEEIEYQYDSLQHLSAAATTGTHVWGGV